MAKSKPTPPAVARAERAVVRAAVRWVEYRCEGEVGDISCARLAARYNALKRAVERLQAARKKGARAEQRTKELEGNAPGMVAEIERRLAFIVPKLEQIYRDTCTVGYDSGVPHVAQLAKQCIDAIDPDRRDVAMSGFRSPAQQIAAARAEGRREGLEQAAQICIEQNNLCGRELANGGEYVAGWGGMQQMAKYLAAAIRAAKEGK